MNIVKLNQEMGAYQEQALASKLDIRAKLLRETDHLGEFVKKLY